MTYRFLLRCSLLPLAVTAALLAASNAAAEPLRPAPATPPPAAAPAPARDGVRFRGAIGVEGGALVLPDIVTLGYGGASSQVGIQINNLVGVYVVPQLNIVFGQAAGLQLGTAMVVDFTIDDIVSVGAGPEVSIFAALGSNTVAAGAFVGGRLHAAVYPLLDKSANGINRQALAIGMDVRFLTGIGAAAESDQNGQRAGATDFSLAPQLTLTYQAF